MSLIRTTHTTKPLDNFYGHGLPQVYNHVVVDALKDAPKFFLSLFRDVNDAHAGASDGVGEAWLTRSVAFIDSSAIVRFLWVALNPKYKRSHGYIMRHAMVVAFETYVAATTCMKHHFTLFAFWLPLAASFRTGRGNMSMSSTFPMLQATMETMRKRGQVIGRRPAHSVVKSCHLGFAID